MDLPKTLAWKLHDVINFRGINLNWIANTSSKHESHWGDANDLFIKLNKLPGDADQQYLDRCHCSYQRLNHGYQTTRNGNPSHLLHKHRQSSTMCTPSRSLLWILSCCLSSPPVTFRFHYVYHPNMSKLPPSSQQPSALLASFSVFPALRACQTLLHYKFHIVSLSKLLSARLLLINSPSGFSLQRSTWEVFSKAPRTRTAWFVFKSSASWERGIGGIVILQQMCCFLLLHVASCAFSVQRTQC